MKNKVLYVILLFLHLTAQAQEVKIDSVYTYEKLEKSTSFAALTLGGDMLLLGQSKTTIDGNTTNLPSQFMPRLNIGGTHFWGHADFYVTFPLGLAFGSNQAGLDNYKFSEGVETGAKIYPWAMKPGRITPYVGISFQPMSFKYSLENNAYKYGGSVYSKFITPIHLGVTYTSQKYMYNLGARWVKDGDFEYYQSPTAEVASSFSPLNFNISIFRFMDTSKSLAKSKSLDQLNIKHYVLEKEGGLSSWYWAFGPSTALQMSKSSYFQKKHPYLYNDMNNSFLVPELAVGRYFHKGDFNINAASRYMHWTRSAFDTKIKMNRISTAIEGYKFLFDYHGFVPFVGPSIMVDHISVNVNGQKHAETKPAIGIVFGWDIRVTQTGTSLLRTNLRYIPGHHVKIDNEKLMFDHLEFNFIQYVKFFGRSKIYKKYRKKD
jgi:hypothetical protein